MAWRTLLFFFVIPSVWAIDIWLGAGWRMDHLDWSLSGPDNYPKIMSELKWKELKLWQISAGVKGTFCSSWIYRLSGDFAKIYAGCAEDADYMGQHRTELYALSQNLGDRGEAFDVKLGVGYPFLRNACYFSPLIGISREEQHLHMRKGNQTVPLWGVVGRFHGLNSHYTARWTTGWIGVDMLYPCGSVALFGSAEYHLGHYHGQGNWNLRQDFIGDFHHHGLCQGAVVTVGSYYCLTCNLKLALAINYRSMWLASGKDRTTFVDDEKNVVEGESNLHAVNWHSFQTGLYISYAF